MKPDGSEGAQRTDSTGEPEAPGPRSPGASGTHPEGAAAGPVRIILPTHLERLAGVSGEVRLSLDQEATLADVIDELEARFPPLAGTIREHGLGRRRAYIRFFAGGHDLSHDDLTDPLPTDVAKGTVPLRVVGAIAGG